MDSSSVRFAYADSWQYVYLPEDGQYWEQGPRPNVINSTTGWGGSAKVAASGDPTAWGKWKVPFSGAGQAHWWVWIPRNGGDPDAFMYYELHFDEGTSSYLWGVDQEAIADAWVDLNYTFVSAWTGVLMLKSTRCHPYFCLGYEVWWDEAYLTWLQNPYTHDDASSLVDYVGSGWQLSRNGAPWSGGPGDPYKPNGWSNLYAGTFSRTDTRDDTATFSFVGNRITYIYTKAYNRAIAEVYIDGDYKTSIDQYCGSTPDCVLAQQGYTYSDPKWSITSLHKIKIRHSGNYNSSANRCTGACTIDVDAFGVNMYDDSKAGAQFTGAGWVLSGFGGCSSGGNGDPCGDKYRALYQGTFSRTDKPLDIVEFFFYGNQITYIYTKAYNRAIANIYIDGEYKTWVNQYCGTPYDCILAQQSYTYTGLTSGIQHRIKIEHSGVHDSSARDCTGECTIDLDAFMVY